MTKRSFLLTVAAGLLASVAFATPSQAGSTSNYLLTASFALEPSTPPPGITATDLTVFFTGAVEPGALTVLPPAGGIGATATGVGSTVEIDFAASNKTSSTIQIEFTAASGLLLTGAQTFSGLTGGTTGTGLQINLTSTAVPEPTSVALLGIGMTGFLAFRRLFKRTAVA
jgi:hypothetical protein